MYKCVLKSIFIIWEYIITNLFYQFTQKEGKKIKAFTEEMDKHMNMYTHTNKEKQSNTISLLARTTAATTTSWIFMWIYFENISF